MAPFLTELANRVKAEGIRVGSYPTSQKDVTVSLLGRDVERVKEIGQEVRMNKEPKLSPRSRVNLTSLMTFSIGILVGRERVEWEGH
jgi:hypothetical protein